MKIIFLLSGLISLVVGVIGIFMPILPTTPFLLLSAYCFARSSERMYNWLMTNRYFGRYISDYRSGYGVPRKIKIFALSFLWLTILATTIFFVEKIAVRIILILIALIVSIHIIKIRTRRERY